MDSLSSLAMTVCSNGSREARSSNSELSRSRCRLLGLLFASDDDDDVSLDVDFKLTHKSIHVNNEYDGRSWLATFHCNSCDIQTQLFCAPFLF